MSIVVDDHIGTSRYEGFNHEDLLDLEDDSDRTDFSFADYNEPLEDDDDVTPAQLYMASNPVSPASTPGRCFKMLDSQYEPSNIIKFPNSTKKRVRLYSAVIDDLRPDISFIDVENLEKFRILINGVDADSEFTDQIEGSSMNFAVVSKHFFMIILYRAYVLCSSLEL